MVTQPIYEAKLRGFRGDALPVGRVGQVGQDKDWTDSTLDRLGLWIAVIAAPHGCFLRPDEPLREGQEDWVKKLREEWD
jgi:hypothetical protein